MKPSIGLKSLAASVPERVLTNDYWRENQPELVAKAEERLWMWKEPHDLSEGSEAFNREMAPYGRDPFRGARERRVMEPGGTALSLEADASRQALAAAELDVEEIDLLICTSFLPDANGIGGATFLARELGLRGAAWNLETACSSATVAFQTACSLVASGQYRNALVVTSCTYSRVSTPSDPISWGIGDAATAMVVGEVEEGSEGSPGGLLGTHSVHSADTCGAVAYHLELDEDGKPVYRLRTGKKAAKLLRETSERYLLECTHGALEQAGLELSDIDHFVFNTPLAWYAAFCARALGVEPRRTLSVYPLYANVGPVLLGLNLLHAAHWHHFRPDDKVLLYSVGSVSSCSAAIVRWGEVALGALPTGVTYQRLRQLEAEAIVGYGLELLEERVLEPMLEIVDPGQRLEELVAAFTRLLLTEPKVLRVFGEEDPDLEELPSPRIQERKRAAITFVSDTIWAARGFQPAEVDPIIPALSLLGIVQWGVATARSEGRSNESEVVEQVMRLALHGLESQLEQAESSVPAEAVPPLASAAAG